LSYFFESPCLIMILFISTKERFFFATTKTNRLYYDAKFEPGDFIFFEGVSSILKPLIFLSPIWIIITIFVVPLMFFMNTPLLKSISYNLSALKVHFFPIIICLLVATLFKYLGFLFFGIGGLLTFPFTTAMIYALYSVVFSEKRP